MTGKREGVKSDFRIKIKECVATIQYRKVMKTKQVKRL